MKTKVTPYYAVIFTAETNSTSQEYADYSELLRHKALENPGFIGIDSAGEGFEITVSYWKDLESIKQWQRDADHCIAKAKGKSSWYKAYRIRITKVEYEHHWSLDKG